MDGDSSVLESCSVGTVKRLVCHSRNLIRSTGLINFCDLSSDDQELLIKRTGIAANDFTTVCYHHEKEFIVRFMSRFRTCCDPMQIHKKPITRSLYEITLYTSKKWSSVLPNLIPGKKICSNCRRLLDQKLSQEIRDNSPAKMEEKQASVEHESTIQDVTNALSEIGCVKPLQLDSMCNGSMKTHQKRKTTEPTCSTGKKNKINDVISLQDSLSTTEDSLEPEEKAKLFDSIVKNVKRSIDNGANRSSVLQMLTIFPEEFSRAAGINLFGVTEKMIKESISLRQEKGIFAMPSIRKGNVLSESTKNLVLDFYQNDEYSWIVPNQKVKLQQKRLILCNLRELYSAFKAVHPGLNVGFSLFATLRPEWCILLGALGTHSAFVCTMHQNTILLLKAGQLDQSYKELVALSVCSEETKDCILLRCPNCPGVDGLRNYLESQFEDLEDIITYNYWRTTDHFELCETSCEVYSYIDTVLKSITKLIPHLFVSKSQSQYLKQRKENLDRKSALLLLNFSENYTFIIKDEKQGYLRAHRSCTVHPVICHYLNEVGVLQTASLCFLSDDLNRDVCTVYHIQEMAMIHLKKIIPYLQSVEYFAPCTPPYKNSKSLYNLCKHREEFGVNPSISYFATNHGRSPCDGIGGAVKRATAKASLQKRTDILTAEGMYKYCKDHLKGIEFYFVQQSSLDALRKRHISRYDDLSPVVGIRDMYFFQPMSSTCIAAKRISANDSYSFMWDFTSSKPTPSPPDVSIGSFIAVAVDSDWYIGRLTRLDASDGDVRVCLMHPKGPAKNFHWPNNIDKQWVAERDVLCLLRAPSPLEIGYEMKDSQIKVIDKIFIQFKLRRLIP